MRTTQDRVVIRPLPKDTISAGGIIIPESANGRPTKAEVIMIGDDERILCRPGDHILFPEHAGFEFSWEGVDLKVIRWADVQMIMNRDIQTVEELIKAIRKHGPITLELLEVVDSGTTNEKLLVDINGVEFHLQGNVLMPVVKQKELANATP